MKAGFFMPNDLIGMYRMELVNDGNEEGDLCLKKKLFILLVIHLKKM